MKSFSDFRKLHNRMIESQNYLLSKGNSNHANDIMTFYVRLIKEIN
jgi:hypothetical protein